MRIHFIQQDSWVLPGEYLAWAERHSYDVTVTKCWEYESIPESADADMLVVLGGCQCPATTKEECGYFDAEQEKTLIRRYVEGLDADTQRELSKMGFNAFALIYRPGAQTACEDLARAIAFIFGHADELEVNTSDYSLWGGSAGARMAAWLGTYGTENFGEDAYPRPAAVIVNYTGLSEVTGYEPPTYSAVGTSDGIASYRTMERRINAIKANGTDALIEVFQGLPHGFGLGTGTAAEGWIKNAVQFWERNMEQ